MLKITKKRLSYVNYIPTLSMIILDVFVPVLPGSPKCSQVQKFGDVSTRGHFISLKTNIFQLFA